jgi:hypothetical protein
MILPGVMSRVTSAHRFEQISGCDLSGGIPLEVRGEEKVAID